MKKGKYVFSLILNFLIIGAIGFASLNMILGFLPLQGASKDFFANLKPLDYLFEFGVIAGLFAALVALITAFSHIVSITTDKPTSKFVGVLKMLSAGLSFLAVINYFLVDAFVLGIQSLGFSSIDRAYFVQILIDYRGPLFFTAIAPLLVVFDYLFFELEPKIKFRNSFFGLIPGILYFGFIALFDYVFVAPGNASFPDIFLFEPFLFSTFSLQKTLIIIGIGVVAILLSTMFLLANRNFIRKFAVPQTKDPVIDEDEEEANTPEIETEKETVEEPKIEKTDTLEEKKEDTVTIEKVEETKEEPAISAPIAPSNNEEAIQTPNKKNVKKVIILKTKKELSSMKERGEDTPTRSLPRVYHVSKQQNGKWQVKLAAGERAIKLFETQEEAITYAKSLVRTKGGSIRIHAVSGKLRKE